MNLLYSSLDLSPFFWPWTYHIISYESQDSGDLSARNTTRASNNIQNLKVEKAKSLAKRNVFSIQLAFENVN